MNSRSNPLEVFTYEVYMYIYMYVCVYKSKLRVNGPRIKARHNSHVESLLLHTRILVDIFLQEKNRKVDDIILKQILPVRLHSDYLKVLLSKLREVYGAGNIKNSPKWQLNKLLAHATHLRKSSHNYDSLIKKLHSILYDIIGEIQLFTQNNILKQHILYYQKNMLRLPNEAIQADG